MSSNKFSTLLGYSNIVISLVQETWLGAADCTYVVMGLWNYCGLIPKLHPLTRRNGFTRPFLLVRGWRGDFIHQTVSCWEARVGWAWDYQLLTLVHSCSYHVPGCPLSSLTFWKTICLLIGNHQKIKGSQTLCHEFIVLTTMSFLFIFSLTKSRGSQAIHGVLEFTTTWCVS